MDVTELFEIVWSYLGLLARYILGSVNPSYVSNVVQAIVWEAGNWFGISDINYLAKICYMLVQCYKDLVSWLSSLKPDSGPAILLSIASVLFVIALLVVGVVILQYAWKIARAISFMFIKLVLLAVFIIATCLVTIYYIEPAIRRYDRDSKFNGL